MTESMNISNRSIASLLQETPTEDFVFSPEFRSSQLTTDKPLIFPGRKDEEWRYTPIKAIIDKNYSTGKESKIDQSLVAKYKSVLPDAIHLIFVNGIFSREMSDNLDLSLPDGLHIKDLASLDQNELARAEALIADVRFTDKNSFQRLALGIARSGLFIKLDENIEIQTPIHILHLHSDSSTPILCNPIGIIEIGAGSHLRMVQEFVSTSNSESLALPLEAIRVGQEATLDMYKLGLESAKANHISNTSVEVESAGSFNSHQYLLGSHLTRSNVEVQFKGSHAKAVLRGIYLGQDEQHLDMRTYLDHAVPDCNSDQHFRGIMDDHSRGVFNGMVLVRKDAQRTDAQQANKNLLLSRDARVDSKPQLEIFADDVKCAHGATIGELDSDALFYLQSRGISKEDGILMLTRAFASEITAEIEFESLQEYIQNEISNRLTQVQITNV